MTIDPRFIVKLRDKDYPTWPGILDAATKAGLRSLTTKIIQAPAPDNGHMAIVLARAEFEDGRVFEDLGDASPANCSAMIATAAIRMASTRAKGRCLRDAVNCGMTMLEELPDANGAGPGDGVPHSPQPAGAPRPNGPRPAVQPDLRAAVRRAERAQVGKSQPVPGPAGHCQIDGCGKPLTKEMLGRSQSRAQMALCSKHLEEILTAK